MKAPEAIGALGETRSNTQRALAPGDPGPRTLAVALQPMFVRKRRSKIAHRCSAADAARAAPGPTAPPVPEAPHHNECRGRTVVRGSSAARAQSGGAPAGRMQLPHRRRPPFYLPR